MKDDHIPYFYEFMDYLDIESGFAPVSIETAAIELRLFFFFLHLEYFEDGVDVKEITAEQIRSFLVFLKEVRGNCATSRNRRLAGLNIYFDYLKASGYLGRQKKPTAGVSYAKTPRLLPVYLSEDEAEKILAAAPIDSEFPYRDVAIMRLCLQTGCRLQELVQLQYVDINLNELAVRYFGKGNVERLVPLTEKTAIALREHMDRRPSVYEHIPEVFLNNRGAPIGRRGVQYLFDRIKHKAGLLQPGLSVHKLRHTCFTMLLRAGVDIVTLQELAGHSDITSTEIYVHVTNAEVRRAMARHPLG